MADPKPVPAPVPASPGVAGASTVPTWAKFALGLGGIAAVGGAVYFATRDDEDDEPKKLPKRRKRKALHGRRKPGKPKRPAGKRARGTKPRRPKRPPAPPDAGPRRDTPPRPPERGDVPPGPTPTGPVAPPRPRRPPARGRGRGRGRGRRDVNPTPAPSEPDRGTVRDKIAGGTERRNAAIAIVANPSSYPERNKTKDPRQTQVDWLSDVAYWSTYPNGPTKIDPKQAEHQKYVKAWLRIRSYVTSGLALKPKLGSHPVDANAGDKANRNWHRWALAVAFSSPVRTAAALREAKRKAWKYVFMDPKGVTWQHEKIVLQPGGVNPTLEGLIADAAVHLQTKSYPEAHRTLTEWPKTMTKAFASANGTAEAS